MALFKHPIDHVTWIDARTLSPNSYNPNVVMNKELELLRLSMLKHGWIQPVLVNGTMIIDGFHRYWLATNDKALIKAFNYMVPVCDLGIDEAEARLVTVRMNRAKGSHIAIKMHQLVTELVKEFGLQPAYIAEQIGANLDEVELLLKEDVFDALEIKKHKYSKAWVPA